MPAIKRSYSSRRKSSSLGFSVMKRLLAGTKRKEPKTYVRKRKNTTLKMDLLGHPFPQVKKTVMVYENELSAGSASNIATYNVACNSMFDFDKHGIFGNKQPLYYDQVLGAAGPYRRYKVTSWRTTYTIINNSATVPVTVWAIPPTTSTSEIDSAVEADNWPGVKRLYLGPLSGSINQGTISVVGNIWDAASLYADSDNNLQGVYNADPATIIYGGLVVHGSDGTTAPSVYIAVKHEFDVELSELDAIVS